MGDEPSGAGWRAKVPGVVLAALAVGVGVRVVLLALPPLFVTDVAYYNAQAVGYLLHGLDPYGASYSVPPPLQTPGAGNVFAYLPGVFLFLVPGGSSPSLGLVASDLIIAAALALFRPRHGGVLAALFLLLPPVVLFSTSFLNDSLPSIAFLAGAVLLESRGRRIPAAAAVGLALASSQEAWFVFPVYLAYCIRSRRYALPLASLAVGGAVVAPFAAWDPGAFVSNALLFQFQRGVPALFSPGPFGVNVNLSLQGVLAELGTGIPLAARAAAAAAFVAALMWRSRAEASYLLWGSAASAAGCLFLLAGDFFWSYLELPFVLVLFWAAVRLERPGPPSTLKEPASGLRAASPWTRSLGGCTRSSRGHPSSS